MPMKQFARSPVVGIDTGGVANAPRGELVWDRAPGDCSRAAEYFEDGGTNAGTEVDGNRRTLVLEVFERPEMSDRKIDNVDIVTYSGSVGGWIVASEYLHGWPSFEDGLENDRHKIGADHPILPDVAIEGRSGGIEVAQRDGAHLTTTVIPPEHTFSHQLRLAIWALGQRWLVFCYGYIGRGPID